jgi:ligand-binding sensor protein
MFFISVLDSFRSKHPNNRPPLIASDRDSETEESVHIFGHVPWTKLNRRIASVDHMRTWLSCRHCLEATIV